MHTPLLNKHSLQLDSVTRSPVAANESELFENLLNSLETGVGLLGNRFNLLYCNAAFPRLMQQATGKLLGQRIYQHAGLSRPAQLSILKKLRASQGWQGIFPAFGDGIKVSITPIHFYLSPELQRHANARYMITVNDHSGNLSQQQALREARQQTIHAEKSKTALLSHITHELRTPLNAIMGFADLLRCDPELSSEQLANVEEISAAGDHMLQLVNRILDFSRLRHGALDCRPEPLRLELVIEEVLSLLRPLAHKAAISLECRNADVLILADRTRLKQVLLNLLSNAIKYNRPQGSVCIGVYRTPEQQIRIEIQDSGRGIHEQCQQSIFNPFERLGVKDHEIEGSGIGLMITRHLVTLMDGSIQLVSAPGLGSVFLLDFPAPAKAVNEHHLPITVTPERQIFWLGQNHQRLEFVRKLCQLRPGIKFNPCNNLAAILLDSDYCYPAVVLIDSQDNPDAVYLLTNTSPHLQQLPLIALTDNSHEAVSGYGTFHRQIQLNPVSILHLLDDIDQR